jgi:hypothetical protein
LPAAIASASRPPRLLLQAGGTGGLGADLHHRRRPPHLPLARGVVKGGSWRGSLLGRGTSLLPPFVMYLALAGNAPPCPCPLPRWGLVIKISLLFRFLMFVVVLVVRALESPSELLTPTGGLPAPQSSCRGRRR